MAITYTDLAKHIGHSLECVDYDGEVTIECNTCYNILVKAYAPYTEDEGN